MQRGSRVKVFTDWVSGFQELKREVQDFQPLASAVAFLQFRPTAIVSKGPKYYYGDTSPTHYIGT